MKTAAMIVITAALFALCLPAFAAQFPDVPTDHWAYAAVQDLADKGVVVGYPDGTFGGKRALSRYEFAQALSRAIPVIAKLAEAAGGVGPAGPKGEAGPAGPPGVTPEELANIRKLMDEFKDELAAQGVDIQAIKKDLAALTARVDAVEREQARVKITAEVPFAFRGTVNNSTHLPDGSVPFAFDRDSRRLGPSENPLQNNRFFDDLELSIKGRVSNNASVTALIAAGNYLPFALVSNPEQGIGFGSGNSEQFNLFNLYLNAGVGLGPLGKAQVTVGRFPFQLTPLTLKFVNPDSYIYVSKLQTGDFPFDGGTVTFKLGKVGITGFAMDSVFNLGIDNPASQFPSALGGDNIPIDQLAGARAVIGIMGNGNLGLTYYQAGNADGLGQLRVYGADLKASFAKIGINGEFAQTNPTGSMKSGEGIPGSDRGAWNAGLSYQLGNLGIGGGYGDVGANYLAPGYWDRMGRAVNFQNVHGPMANISYALTSKIMLTADGQFLTPKTGNTVFARTAIDPGAGTVSPGNIDRITGWKAGVKYGLTATNAIDLGMEEVLWKAQAGAETKERYYTIGLGHTINPNASLKLLYQIVDYKQGDVLAYFDNGSANGSYRGGVTTAEFHLKY